MQIVAGKYEIKKELGEGGVGTVYQVRHVDLGVDYALKILNTASVDGRFIDRFKREAEVLIKFQHPGSVALRDFGKTEDGNYYMAMDFCNGQTLRQVLDEQGELPVRRVFLILEQLLDTLQAAHTAGIVHRDIKPENIMLEFGANNSDVVKILDFGIAKLREQPNDSSKTTEGVSVGTPQYMSPEQASGESKLDERVDIYSLGCVVYEMITGKAPFIGESVIQTLIMHLTQPPKPFANDFGLPEAIESLVFKSIEKNKDARYQSAKSFKESLDQVKDLVIGKQTLTSNTIAVKTIEPEIKKEAVKILCLDDSEMILHIFKHIMEEKGFIVYTANNSSVVHKYLFEEGVKLLVADVQMPDIPGTKVCRMLKKSIPDLKVILFSNLPERELDKLSQESQADGWMSKNQKPIEWVNYIDEIVKTMDLTKV